MKDLVLQVADDIVSIVWSGLSKWIVEDYPQRQEEERASLLHYVEKPRVS